MPKNKVIRSIRICSTHVTLIFDDGSTLKIDRSIYPNFYLYVGKTLSGKEEKEIIRQNGAVETLNYALSLLKKSLYSEWKLREKLYQKEADKETVDYVIKRLKTLDLLNDEMYAEDLYNYLSEQGYGKNKIIAKLSEKGIFPETYQKLKFPVSREMKKAKDQLTRLEKKYASFSSQKKKDHIRGALMNLGFDNEVIHSVLELVKDHSEKEETSLLKKDYLKAYTLLKRKYEGRQLKEKLVRSLQAKGYKMKEILNEVNEHEID